MIRASCVAIRKHLHRQYKISLVNILKRVFNCEVSVSESGHKYNRRRASHELTDLGKEPSVAGLFTLQIPVFLPSPHRPLLVVIALRYFKYVKQLPRGSFLGSNSCSIKNCLKMIRIY
jgi:hypothetical protein